MLLLKIEGLNSTRQAVSQLGADEHLWVRGIGDVLIYVRRLSETTYSMCIYSAERATKRFTVKGLLVNGKVKAGVVVKLIEKLSARPCRVVGSNLVDAETQLKESESSEIDYTEFITLVKGSNIRVQASPLS